MDPACGRAQPAEAAKQATNASDLQDFIAQSPSVLDRPVRKCSCRTSSPSHCFQSSYNRRDRVPVARRHGHAEDFLELAKVADGFHLAAVQAADKLTAAGEDLQTPLPR